MAKKKKLPTDTNKKDKSVVYLATGDNEEAIISEEISKYMAIIGRKGGKKGGVARKDALTAKQRTEIAKKAAAARWGNKQ